MVELHDHCQAEEPGGLVHKVYFGTLVCKREKHVQTSLGILQRLELRGADTAESRNVSVPRRNVGLLSDTGDMRSQRETPGSWRNMVFLRVKSQVLSWWGV